jgi:hypothetical protein
MRRYKMPITVEDFMKMEFEFQSDFVKINFVLSAQATKKQTGKQGSIKA